LKAVIEGGLADISLRRGAPGGSLVKVEMTADDPDARFEPIEYKKRGDVGYLSIDLGNVDVNSEDGEKKSKKGKGFDLSSTTWNLLLSDKVPISLDVELGLGEGDLDLTGLKVKDFDLSTGASSVRLRFDAPNPATMENMSISAGASKLRAVGLGNANFKNFRFEGGVGSYTLDFTGELRHEVDVELEVGLGVLTVILPKEAGARLMFEDHWMCEMDLDKGFTAAEGEEDAYLTENFRTAKGRFNIRVDAGFGSVKIRRDE
jgi:hypothetical protein